MTEEATKDTAAHMRYLADTCLAESVVFAEGSLDWFLSRIRAVAAQGGYQFVANGIRATASTEQELKRRGYRIRFDRTRVTQEQWTTVSW